ncbi:unnamed protein product [Durusdinium trenchii]|uniref:Uncharacterized protein n=1 Tax=Durusdinium trenchii TaxID=1381693 RepID=A0ABP0IS81_9DINO
MGVELGGMKGRLGGPDRIVYFLGHAVGTEEKRGSFMPFSGGCSLVRLTPAAEQGEARGEEMHEKDGPAGSLHSGIAQFIIRPLMVGGSLLAIISHKQRKWILSSSSPCGLEAASWGAARRR